MSSKRIETIDVFNHFLPREYLNVLPKPLDSSLEYITSKRRAVFDIEYRVKDVTKLGISKQILTLGNQAILDDAYYPVDILPRLARAANDGIAKAVEKHPDRFYGVGTVTLYDIDQAIDELDRCVNDLGMLGVQIISNVGGKPLDLPQFDPFYDRLCHHGVGLWIHPGYMRKAYDWLSEYHFSSLIGWEVDESLAMLRMARGGVFERHPDLKVITHHLGSMIPFCAYKIHMIIMRDGKNGRPPKPLKKPAMDYLKMFYVDTAEGNWKLALQCSYLFYGPRRILFATDYPYGPMVPRNWPAQVIANIMGLDANEEEKKMILSGNVRKLFRLD
jgi:predicted TIM-barrel fold metal-dependent hydrolase